MMPIRYIRDWCNGNTISINNHWAEIEAITLTGTNAALGCATTSIIGAGSATITNGNTASGDMFAPGSGLQWVRVDLGSLRADIAKVMVWHYWSDARKYHATRTEVSADGVTWVTIYDSAVSGEYTETSAGFSMAVPSPILTLSHTAGYFAPLRNPARPQVAAHLEQAADRTAGGVTYAFDPEVSEELITLAWSGMSLTDVTALRTFFQTTAKGMTELFTLIDPWSLTSYQVCFAEPTLGITESAPLRYAVTCSLRRVL